jgi:bifunctional enzyme CysN/CysC/sulfate adenylyltransferase subunit 1
LETVHIASDWTLSGFRLPVQWVNRPENPANPALHDFRGFSGQIAGGVVRVGQPVLHLPSRLQSRVKAIHTAEGPAEEAWRPQSVTIELEDDLDISRGDLLAGLETPPGAATELRAKVCWMHPRPLQPGRKYFLKHTTQTVQAIVTAIESKLDFTDLEPQPNPGELALNDIGELRLRTSRPLHFDGYTENRLTGSFILIEPGSNATAGAGMLLPPNERVKPEFDDFAI